MGDADGLFLLKLGSGDIPLSEDLVEPADVVRPFASAIGGFSDCEDAGREIDSGWLDGARVLLLGSILFPAAELWWDDVAAFRAALVEEIADGTSDLRFFSTFNPFLFPSSSSLWSRFELATWGEPDGVGVRPCWADDVRGIGGGGVREFL